MKHLPLLVVAVLMLCSCHNDYTPKPYAYLRIDLPEHEYFLLDTMRTNPGDTLVFDGDTAIALTGITKTFPFIFEANQCIEWTEKDAPKGERWIDLMYPQWDGVVFLTYRPLKAPDSLRTQVDESMRLLEQHYKVASGIEEQGYEDPEHKVYGTVYYLKGRKVASTCQFWLTDSTHHFLRGALFLNTSPNNDSLAPVIDYIQADIEHLVETLRWR
jgi:gliding motility-associated lipoprotein GldD